MILVVKVAVMEDFSTELHPLKAETIEVKRSRSSSNDQQNKKDFFIPLVFLPMFFYSGRSRTQITSNKEAFEASKKIVSCGLYYTIVMTLHHLFPNVLYIFHTAIVFFTYSLFILIRFPSLSVGFQVFARTPGSSCVHFQSKGP